jgi:hypothetical protein
MNKRQLDSLSASLSKAINPAVRKVSATARILEQVEPLPVVSRSRSSDSTSYHDPHKPVSEQPPVHVQAPTNNLWKTPWTIWPRWPNKMLHPGHWL